MKKITVGIIGGTGQMGKFFARFFKNNGCKVLVSSRKSKLKPKDCAKSSDVVIVSVPIVSVVKVIKDVSPHIDKNSLLIDTTSIKKEPVDAMLRFSKCEVIGMHPVFGPNVSSLKNQTIVLCPVRSKKWIKWIKNIFQRNGAKLKITTPEKHDEMMSIIQGLNHFTALSFIYTMKKLNVTIKDSIEYSSPLYKLRMLAAGKILNQSPRLYAGIEIENSKNKKVLAAYLESAKKLQRIVEKGSTEEFLRYFDECSEFLGDFKKDAEEISDYLIEEIAKL